MINEIDKEVSPILGRCRLREVTLLKSTVALITAFVTDGSTETEAKDKVRLFSRDLTTRTPGAKTDFTLGDTQPLIDSVNASVLVDMTAAKKLIVTDILSQAV